MTGSVTPSQVDAREPTGVLDIGLAVGLTGSSLKGRCPLDELLAAVDHAHFTSLWSLENPLADQPEPLVWLTAAALSRPNLVVGTAALVAPLREPVLLARQLATLDRLSGGGRLILGCTIGRRQEDYDATGHNFALRGRILEDVIVTLRQCFARQPVDVAGAERAICTSVAVGPPPVAEAGPPILIGGHAVVAMRRAVRLADGYLGGATSGPRHALSARQRLIDLLSEAERDITSFRFVTNVFVHLGPSRAEALEAAAEVLARRHQGRAPYDPAEVVAAGTVDEVASALLPLALGGFDGINLVPVTMDVDEIARLGQVVDLLRQAAETR